MTSPTSTSAAGVYYQISCMIYWKGLYNEVKLMLRAFIYDEHYFTLEELNTRLEVMELGYMESKERLTPITVADLQSGDSALARSGKLTNVYAL